MATVTGSVADGYTVTPTSRSEIQRGGNDAGMFRRGAPADPFDAPDRPSARDEVLAALAPMGSPTPRGGVSVQVVAPATRPARARSSAAARGSLRSRPRRPAGCAAVRCPAPPARLGALPADPAALRLGAPAVRLRRGRVRRQGAWAAFSEVASLVRVVPIGDHTADRTVAQLDRSGGRFPPSATWAGSGSTLSPDPEDPSSPGSRRPTTFDLRSHAALARWSRPGNRCPSTTSRSTTSPRRRGDSWPGWPSWLQAPRLPELPDRAARPCGAVCAARLLSDTCLRFRRHGVGHGHQCPTHLRVVAFAWSAG